jgi:hypothetical protein
LSAGQFPAADSQRLCVYLLEEALRQLPAGQEQLVGIFDLRGFGVQNADVLFATFMVRSSPWLRLKHECCSELDAAM